MKKIIFIILALFLVTNSFSQKGFIRGQVKDQTTGETLIGATMLVVGSEPMIATITDYDGNYSLDDVPEGTYSIQCTYVSYQKQIIENVEVKSKNVAVINISLAPETQDIGEVNIVASAIQNTENSLLSIQKKSVTLLNGVSSQTISRMGDSDAASAMKRVTGVSVEGGKYIFVRGLSDRYSKVTLNGAEIPGLDPSRNTVQLDMFSTNIIDNIVVQKTFSPDLPASFAGGYVNISTKSFPNKFTLQFSTSFGYNSQANFNNQFISFDAGNLAFLGMNDGSLTIPELAQNKVPSLYENNSELDKITASFNKKMVPEIKTSFMNHSHSFSVGNQVKFLGKPLGFIFDMSYARDFKAYNNGDYARYNLVGGADNNFGVMSPLIIENEVLGEEEVITSSLLGISYKLTPLHKIGVTLIRSGGGLISARQRQGYKTSDNMYMFENTLGFQERALNSAQLNGNHVFGKDNKFQADWTSSFTKSILNEPDLRFFNYDSVTGGEYEISYSAYPAPARFYRDLNEINFDNKANFAWQLPKMKLKFGASYTLKSRNSVSTQFNILSQGLQFNGNIEEYLSDQNIGQNAQNATYGTYYQNDEITDNYNSYNALEHIAGFYGLTEFQLNENIDVQAGLRYEYDYISIENLVQPYHFKYVEASKAYKLDFLPALNVNYLLSKNMNLRFAYSRTLGRPAFREIAPYAYYDFKEAWRVVGNPDLERTVIDNIDLRWEKFMENGQLISFSAFAKYFTKPIELIDDPRAGNPELHYVNADNSFLYGIELELRKNLDFIGLKNFMLGGNFTFLKSQVRYVEDYGSSTTSLAVNRPMYGQAPWVINFYLNYDNQELGLNSNLAFNVDGAKLAVVTKGSTPDVYQQPLPLLNYTISKKIGAKFSLKASIGNILDATHKKSYTYEDQQYVFQKHQLGRTFSLAIKYLIE